VSLDLRAVVQKMRNISPSETAALGIAAPTVSLPQAGDPFETAAGTTYRNDGLAGFPG
jgi:hypothetical protein